MDRLGAIPYSLVRIWFSKQVRYTVFLFFTLCIFICGVSHLLSVKEYIVVHDQLLWPGQHTVIDQFFRDNRFLYGRQFITKIKETFPFIDDVEVSHLCHNRAHVVYHVHRPIILINDDLCLLSNQSLVHKSVYSPEWVQNITGVTLSDYKDNESIDPDVLHQLSLFSDHVFDRYNVVWHSKTDILLCDNENPLLAVRASMDALSSHLFAKASQVINEHHLQKSGNRKSSQGLIADIRFEKQVIVYAHKKEDGHGSNII